MDEYQRTNKLLQECLQHHTDRIGQQIVVTNALLNRLLLRAIVIQIKGTSVQLRAHSVLLPNTSTGQLLDIAPEKKTW